VEALFGAPLDRGPRIRAYPAKADAFVSEARRTKNFGEARELRLDSSPTLRAYIRFDTSLPSYEVEHVTLLVYSRVRSRVGFRVRAVTDSWREREITFKNAPPTGGSFVASGRVRRFWNAVDVTSLVTYDEKSVSFVLTTPSAQGLELASRETGHHGPRLVVERQRSSTTSTSTNDSD
jgi:hypothetical protein